MEKTCKECVCNELCTTIGFNSGFKGGEQCRHFKDKELFIELPCKVGDKAYVINELEVEETTVFSMKIESQDSGWVIFLKAKVNDHGIKFKGGYGSVFKTFIFGKTVFLTREDAEKELKERNNG